jgi:hypothetical protein
VIWHILLLFLAQAFWQSKPPAEWNDLELARFLADSPWAQMAAPSAKAGSYPPIAVYLATAAPVEKFTIAIIPGDAHHGTLAMEWGPFRWTAVIVVQ